jgi:hypothetical protein
MTPLHAILLSEGSARESPWREASLHSFEAAHPGAVLRLYRDESLRNFIADHFDRGVLAAYDGAERDSKANLGRYCLLYEQGGVYSDPTLYFMAPVVTPDVTTPLRLFRRADGAREASLALIAAPARMDVFARCVETATRVLAGGAMATGSALFASVLATFNGSIDWGEESLLPGLGAVDRHAYKSAAGHFVAVSKARTDAGGAAQDARTTDEEDITALLAMLDGWL